MIFAVFVVFVIFVVFDIFVVFVILVVLFIFVKSFYQINLCNILSLSLSMWKLKSRWLKSNVSTGIGSSTLVLYVNNDKNLSGLQFLQVEWYFDNITARNTLWLFLVCFEEYKSYLASMLVITRIFVLEALILGKCSSRFVLDPKFQE